MSNLANYSPYNKTYKFMLFQNQAYHEKNKRQAKPCVRTNLRYTRPSTSCFLSNPEENFDLRDSKGKPATRSTQRCDSPDQNTTRSMLMSKNLALSQPQFDKPKRIIHKNQSFEKFQKKRIENDNKGLVKRLLNSSCEVAENRETSRSFEKHLKYR